MPMFSKSNRSHVTAATLGAALLLSPLAPALAQSDTKMADHASRAAAQEDTIEQRITTLHGELKITPSEETDWKAVAQTMRDNASAMAQLAAQKESQGQSGMTAVQDLQTYAEFAQAHVDHLKKLTSAFETLYDAMPAAQKKVADQVFERSHRQDSDHQG
jgi:hypothetical protein